jgi:hypothetical protein
MVEELRSKLKTAFRNLRKQNQLVALANYSCCQSCAGYAIGQRIEQNPSKYRGYVFWTKQDDEVLEDLNFVYLAFGSKRITANSNTPQEESNVIIGREIKHELEKTGLKVEWNETANERIKVVS